MTDAAPEIVTLYCSGCDEPTSFPAKRLSEVPPGELFVWDCRPCGHRNQTALPAEGDASPTLSTSPDA